MDHHYKSKALLTLAFMTLTFAAMGAVEEFGVLGMPDFDQRRNELPGKGSMYCAPTSVYNIFNFFATHGLSKFKNHPFDPANAILTQWPHTGHSMRISRLGAYMGTDAVEGTKGGLFDGAVNYTNATTNYPILFIHWIKNGNFPSFNAPLQWMKLGGYTSLCYGRYGIKSGQTSFHLERHGGHCVTLRKVRKTTTTVETGWWFAPTLTTATFHIWYRNPWTGDADPINAQSTWADDENDLFLKKKDFNGVEDWLYGIGTPKPGKDYAYIDQLTTIMPFQLLTNVQTETNYGLNAVQAFKIDPTTGRIDPAIQPVRRMLTANTEAFVDMAWDPFLPTVHVLKGRGTQLWEADETSARTRLRTTLPQPGRKLVFGGVDQDLYVLMTDTVAQITPDGRIKKTLKVGTGFEAMVYDPYREMLVLANSKGLQDVRPDLEPGPFRSLPALAGTGPLQLDIAPYTGLINFGRLNGKVLYRAALNDLGFFTAQGLPLPGGALRAFTFGAQGELIVNQGGRLKTYSQEMEPMEGPFTNKPSGNFLKGMRHRSNFDYAKHSGPGWENVPPAADGSV
jgi:hypothetical protein